MRKVFLSLFMMFTTYGASMAQTFTVEYVEVLPGTTGKYTLKINVGEGEYTGFQYDIQFPSSGFSTPTTGKSTVNGTWSGGSINPGDLTAGKGKLSALSMSNALIPTGNIEIGTVSFDVANDVPLGEYDVTISNFEFLSGTTRTPVSDVTFKVKVVNAFTVILDETSTTPPVNATGVNIIVKRTIKANEWSTICLPFAMTEAQAKTAFGDDVQIADFMGCEATYDEATGEDIVALKVNFDNITAMEANHPYIIKVTSDVAECSVEGVDITPSDELSVDRNEYKYKRNGKWYYDYNSFIGTYEAGTEVPENSLFLSGNKFWYSTGLTKTKAFRGYFAFYMLLSDISTAEARISIGFSDDKTTGIAEIENGKLPIDNSAYDLQGRKVLKPVKGLYIRNGRKEVAK